MSLKLAMLGFLDMFPFTGYDLKKMFDSSVSFYWSATHSQIYRSLTEMEAEGLLTEELVTQSDFPNKKRYHITEKGKSVLREWILKSPEIPPLRHKLLVQLSWADRLTNNEIRVLLSGYADCLETRLAQYTDDEHLSIAQQGRTSRERYLWNALLKNGIEIYKTELEWVNQTLDGLVDFDEKTEETHT